MDRYRLVPNDNTYMDIQYDCPFYDTMPEEGFRFREAYGRDGQDLGRMQQGSGLVFEHSGLFPPDIGPFPDGVDYAKSGNVPTTSGSSLLVMEKDDKKKRATTAPATTKRGAEKRARKEANKQPVVGKVKKGEVWKVDKGSLGASSEGGASEDHEVKRMKRLLRNRVSAQLARERKKQYIQGLEKNKKESDKKIKDLTEKVKRLTEENKVLKKRLSSAQQQK
ncbi:BZIP domain-containing protein [Chloropicon primus]|uniref:BZIP domain-containing protein n=1 Tax=Chloropicon primus TaxID=1764295 RepID=A0A5B8MJA1_9CHLO|nr:hypothetical protein A3770_04p30840 [Chloropicon primus]UPQ99777.1 BZIP domain-containing protein [Chloropicon primus]|mmetsp:Transcript_4291/g.12584  ORF Transcript_4291/g.12584 Transcript_4291/m.12584 type:complete len:222 (+) Transcript_4291:231-896(+)|eukprot:QDZ20566.1 hypothetical protein A3770_04p30840 [Chloropicon primus]